MSELLPSEGAFQHGDKPPDCLPCGVPAWERSPECGLCSSLPGSHCGTWELNCPEGCTRLGFSTLPLLPHSPILHPTVDKDQDWESSLQPPLLHEGGCESLSEEAVKGVLTGQVEKDLPPTPPVTLQRSMADPLGGVLRPRLCPWHGYHVSYASGPLSSQVLDL